MTGNGQLLGKQEEHWMRSAVNGRGLIGGGVGGGLIRRGVGGVCRDNSIMLGGANSLSFEISVT